MGAEAAVTPTAQPGGGPQETANERLFWRGAISKLTRLSFAAFVAVSLASQSEYATTGPFTWGALPLPGVAKPPLPLGLLSLLPGLIAVGWLGVFVAERPRSSWRWGWRGVTLPLLAFTVLATIGLFLGSASTDALVGALVGLSAIWFVALFVINQRPNLTVPLALVILSQGGVAVAQHLFQRDLGLAALGEPSLDPTVYGISVVGAGEQHWLRAYGLTAHPNQLGAFLAVLLILVLPALQRSRGWRRTALALAVGVGFVGLLMSFSRASWIAFTAGLVVWLVVRGARSAGSPRGFRSIVGSSSWIPGGFLLLFAAFVIRYPDLVVSRFWSLDSPLESRSMSERLHNPPLALEIIAAHPWQGVGMGNYDQAAYVLDPDAVTVHNIPLLVAAELGLPVAALWLWLLMAPFVRSWKVETKKGRGSDDDDGALYRASDRDQIAPWVTYIVLGMFDYTLSPLMILRGGLLLGLLLGCISLEAADRQGTPRTTS